MEHYDGRPHRVASTAFRVAVIAQFDKNIVLTMEVPVTQTVYQLEYLQQVIEAEGESGAQLWLDFFKAGLDQSRFDDCERLLATAKRSSIFSTSESMRTTVIHNEGLLRLFQGRLDEAEQCFQKALALDRRLRDRYNEAQSLTNLGEVERLRNQWQAALEYYKASAQIHQVHPHHPLGLAQVLNNMGLALMSLGSWMEAEQAFERALSIFRQLNEQVEIARALNNLGRLYRERGESEKALNQLQEALERFRKLGDEYGQASVLNTLGALNRQRGEWEDARQCYEASLQLCWKVSDHVGIAHALNNMGELHRTVGNFDEALKFYQEGLQMAQTLSEQPIVATIMSNMGLVAAGQTRWADAVNMYQQSLKLKIELGDIEGQAITLNNLGVAYEHLEQSHHAMEAYQQAARFFQRVGNRPLAAATLINLSQPPVGQALSRDERQRLLEEALTLLAGTKAQEYERVARQLLVELHANTKDNDD